MPTKSDAQSAAFASADLHCDLFLRGVFITIDKYIVTDMHEDILDYCISYVNSVNTAYNDARSTQFTDHDAQLEPQLASTVADQFIDYVWDECRNSADSADGHGHHGRHSSNHMHVTAVRTATATKQPRWQPDTHGLQHNQRGDESSSSESNLSAPATDGHGARGTDTNSAQ